MLTNRNPDEKGEGELTGAKRIPEKFSAGMPGFLYLIIGDALHASGRVKRDDGRPISLRSVCHAPYPQLLFFWLIWCACAVAGSQAKCLLRRTALADHQVY